MKIAQQIEEKKELLKKEVTGSKWTRAQQPRINQGEFSTLSSKTSGGVEQPFCFPAVAERAVPQKIDFPFQKLTDSEWQEKREKGLSL